ncbi:MAG: UMP kinase [Alphaproteobacteria bacterium]|nr:UMP kinase [Alphaproteobacteria bacterium]
MLQSDSPYLYKRVLLKISGEVLAGDRSKGNFDTDILQSLARDIISLVNGGVEIAIVVGGGNIFRSMEAKLHGIERATADYMGMLATVMNALALQSALEYNGIDSRVQSAIPMHNICEPYIRRRALRHIERGRVVIFAAGSGNPFFTTDTAAALRASEIQCDVLAKATKVDGIYDCDPKTNPNAQKLNILSYQQALNSNLKVMDASALSLCAENRVPILVFSILNADNALSEAIKGNGSYSKVTYLGI